MRRLRRNLYYILFVMFGLVLSVSLWPSIAHAQEPVGVDLVADNTEFTVGDVVNLTLEITHPESYQVFPDRLPKAWGSFDLTGEEEAEYRRILYGNNLDLVFHRICYWTDGRRTLLDILHRLEFEMEELMQDTGISRTSSGAAIAVAPINLSAEAFTIIVDRLIEAGYLEESN